PVAAILDRRLTVMLEALMHLRKTGYTEGVAYDGYLLDFLADWLALLPAAERTFFLEHPEFAMQFTESLALGVPGDAASVAPLSDVEPREMCMHIGAHAKCHRLKANPALPAYLRRCRLDWQPSQSLAAQRENIDEGVGAGSKSAKEDATAGIDAQYALVLRSGSAAEDLAVAMSANRSPMPHMHKDNGTIVIGTRGRWLLTDPGYQQYLETSERQFAIGPTAHNVPVVNGEAQVLKKPGERRVTQVSPGLWRADVAFSQCYAAALGVTAARRSVWLAGKQTVVVADRIGGPGVKTLAWHWHAHAEAAWSVEGEWAAICVPGVNLWIRSLQAPMEGAAIRRLKGSRGQQTLIQEIQTPPPVIWWIMAVGDRPPAVRAMGPERIAVERIEFAL
ncbi:MAG TPA: heparinase II/III family protein, partial [Planctomycetota bacterium]|nr:heparinase II/III family protein [Planctomycetota bacterium]